MMKNISYLMMVILTLSIFGCDFGSDDMMEEPPVKLPLSYFEMDKTTCDAPCEIVFSNYSNNHETCEWDFGDGSSFDISCNTTHTFEIPGEYEIRLKVTSSTGATAVSTNTVNITEEEITGGDTFTGVKIIPSGGNQAVQKVIEIPEGFLMLCAEYSGNPLEESPTKSFLVKLDNNGNLLSSAPFTSEIIGLDMIKTGNDRIFICGSSSGYGKAIEISTNFVIKNTYTSDLEGSVFTSIDHNGVNEIFMVGYQEVGGLKGALAEKLSSGFLYRERWKSFDEFTNTSFDNVVCHGGFTYLTAYIENENKSVIYKMLDDLSDADGLVIVELSKIVGLGIDEDRVYAPAIRPVGFRSHLTEYSHDLELLDDLVIAMPATVEILYPTGLQMIDGHLLLSSIILYPGEACSINAALQRICTSGTQCTSALVNCPEEQSLIMMADLIQLENGEYLAVGTSSSAAGVFDISYLKLNSNFELQ